METRLFRNDRRARFLRRPNRFLIIAADPATGEELRCHCPNPGSMAEFTLPGTPLILERRTGEGATAWTAVAVEYRDAIVPLYAARANALVEALVLPRLFPGAREIQPEFRLGSSRFDFRVLDARGSPHLVEVKSCTLVEEGVALFPDAPSLRATRHLEELAAAAQAGWRSHVLFLIQHGHPEVFAPNLHTDPAFAATLGRLAPLLDLRAISAVTTEEGMARLENEAVPLDLSHSALAEENRGSYLMVLELPEAAQILVGSLGELDFPPGWYVYSGSAQRGLAERVARHRRRVRKARHWHLDYLSPAARKIQGLPIASPENLECELAEALSAIGGAPIPRFGSSDCHCGSHLFRFHADPLKNRAFLDLLFHFRHRRVLGLPR